MVIGPDGTINVGFREVFLAGTTLSLTLQFTEIVDNVAVPIDIDNTTEAVYRIYDILSGATLVTVDLGDGIVIDGTTFVITVDPADTEELYGELGNEFKWTDNTGRVGGAPGRIRVARTRITSA